MFKTFYYKLRFDSYLKNEHGIKKFAERCMGELIRKVTKKSAFYREMNENLKVEKANLRLRSDALEEESMLAAGEFFSMRRRLWANTFVMTTFVMTAVFLNLLSVAVLVGGETVLMGVLRWVSAVLLALVLTGGGLVVTERLIESIISPRRSDARPERQDVSGIGMTLLWGVLLVGIELALLGLADVEAQRLAAGSGSSLLYFGYVMLSMLLPIVAGAVRWDAMRYIDVFKTTQALREIESRLAQVDSVLRQNDEYESNFYKLKSIAYWDRVNDFKTYKDNRNQKRGITEGLRGHFAQAYDAFQQEAGKRYGTDLRDVTTRSMRRLEQAEAPAGRKLGQKGERPPLPTAGGDGDGALRTADPYFAPKPIR